jgi:hypothetical protein
VLGLWVEGGIILQQQHNQITQKSKTILFNIRGHTIEKNVCRLFFRFASLVSYTKQKFFKPAIMGHPLPPGAQRAKPILHKNRDQQIERSFAVLLFVFNLMFLYTPTETSRDTSPFHGAQEAKRCTHEAQNQIIAMAFFVFGLPG